MNDFQRNIASDTMFEGVSDEVTPIVLKFKDDYAGTWKRNTNNTLKFEQVKRILTSEPRVCFFQKQKSFDKTNKFGERESVPQHKIIVPIGEEKAIEFGVSLWKDRTNAMFNNEVYSYSVRKCKEIALWIEPTKDTHKSNCSFTIANQSDKTGTNSTAFQNLCITIEELNIPTVDINKEKDKEIWKNYVVALKKLVKQKEQVWKIQKISKPYTEKTNGNERATFIDFFISEKDLIQQFEREIEDYFNVDELEDYGVSEDRAFIEFNNYRELSQEEKDKITILAAEYFYDISKDSPTHYISGKFNFKYADITSKDEIISQLKEILLSDYQIEIEVDDNGYLDISANDFPHIQKVVSDNFDFILELKQDNSISLKVQVEKREITPQIVNQVKSKLQEKGLNSAKVRLADENNLFIEVGSFLAPDTFLEEGLRLDKTVTRFSTNMKYQLKEVEGLEINGNTYTAINLQNYQSKKRLEDIKNVNEDLSFRRLPTQYYFALSQKRDIEKLRDFKTKTDIQGKTNFDIAKSVLTINAENSSEYNAQIDRIKQAFPNVSLEDKAYKSTFFLQFKTDLENQRQSIVGKIQNEIRRKQCKVEYDVLKNHTRILFSYNFNTEDERDAFKQVVSEVCTPYQNLLKFGFENDLGRTTYEFIKNETLELEREKEVVNNVRQATFIYLTPEEREKLNQAIESFGDDAIFREGKQIGTLIRKEREKLKFRISDRFDDLLNAKDDERLALEEIKKGYIKPIFPGELTNIGRMIKAMKKVTEPGNKVGFPANKNLSNFLFDPNTARQFSEDIEEEKKRILSNLNEPLLKNQSKQLEAVAKSLFAKDVALIQGPPGTGKTTVIAEIIWQTLLREPEAKILITSQTNLAVDNALERLKGKKLVRPIRIGNIDKFEDEGKVYSNERLKQWLAAKPNSNEETINSDNAICEWVKNVSEKCSDNAVYQKAITKWKQGLSDKDSLIKSTFASEYFKNVNVFAATCSECGSRNFGEAYQSMFQKNKETQGEPEFDLVIMDEASKATPPELVLPLTLGKKVIIIGDHKQLPPMIDENEFSEALEAVGAKKLVEDWTKDDYKISQFEKLFVNAPKNFVASLDTQFRMHEQIMNCISQFYKDQEELENGLICGIRGEMNIENLAEKASRWHGFNSQPFITPQNHAIWVNVETPEKKVGTSYENDGEVKAIQTVLRALTHANGFKEYLDFFKKEEDKEVGIITYYMPQMQKIRNAMYPTFTKNEWRNFEQHKYKNEFQLPFRINTVDRFQGMERNIIIISTVRSDRQIDLNGKEIPNKKYPFALGFARELQRVNVGFSRAKRLLIVIGNERHFTNKSEYAEAIQKMHRVDIAQLQNL
jgi:superfamily I DNA and/or RNA helicase